MRRLFMCTTDSDDSDLEFDCRLDVTEIDSDYIYGTLPKSVDEFMVFDFAGKNPLAIDMGAVLSMLDYLPDKPKVIMQTLLRLTVAVTNKYHQTSDELNSKKDEFDLYAAQRTTYFADEDNGMQFKRTASNIESFVKAEPTYQRLSKEVQALSTAKSKLWSTKEILSKTLDMVRDFVQHSPSVMIDDEESDRSFYDILKGVAVDVAKMEVESE